MDSNFLGHLVSFNIKNFEGQIMQNNYFQYEKNLCYNSDYSKWTRLKYDRIIFISLERQNTKLW